MSNGTVVINGKEVELDQQAYIDNGVDASGATVAVYYSTATSDGHDYRITWQMKDGFDGEDESDACDWDEYEIDGATSPASETPARRMRRQDRWLICDLAIDLDGEWKLYAGAAPLPPFAVAKGVVRRAVGDAGALVMMPTGIYVQINAGVIRSLPQAQVKGCLKGLE